MGCGEKPPEGYEGWKVKKLLNTVSYCVPTSWKQEKNNKDYHNYKINDTTTVRIYIEEETMHGFTKAEEIINDYEKKKAAYNRGDYYTPSTFIRQPDISLDGQKTYHYQDDPSLGIVRDGEYVNNNIYDCYICDCSKGMFNIIVIFDKDAGNPISEDEMNKLLESVQFKDFDAKEE